MDRAQAGEIFGHLFDAARELDEARAVASALAPQDESAASLDVVQAQKLCEQLGLEISYEGLAAPFRYSLILAASKMPAISGNGVLAKCA